MKTRKIKKESLLQINDSSAYKKIYPKYIFLRLSKVKYYGKI
jgi:hypothetical protein